MASKGSRDSGKSRRRQAVKDLSPRERQVKEVVGGRRSRRDSMSETAVRRAR
jgi:DNA-binding CsgD family transcriptional regulator